MKTVNPRLAVVKIVVIKEYTLYAAYVESDSFRMDVFFSVCNEYYISRKDYILSKFRKTFNASWSYTNETANRMAFFQFFVHIIINYRVLITYIIIF